MQMSDKNLSLLAESEIREKQRNRNNIILTSRARLARNISGLKFNSISGEDEKNYILNLVRNVATQVPGFKGYRFYAIKKLPKVLRDFLVERHVMSPEMGYRMAGKGILVGGNIFNGKSDTPGNFKKVVSIMINEEDHLRIQCVVPGFDIKKPVKEVMKIERRLEKALNFAFDRHLGYLTSCPTNLGTGLRISVIAHLPGLVISSEMDDFIKTINKLGYGVRGYYGENSEVVGNLFQIFNQVTLGKSEDSMVEEMQAICLNIIDSEERARQELKKNNLISLEDGIYRSYGMLKYARMLSFEEALELLSVIKLGVDLNLVDNVKKFNLYELVSFIGDCNIVVNLKRTDKPTEDEIDLARASLIRKKILKGD